MGLKESLQRWQRATGLGGWSNEGPKLHQKFGATKFCANEPFPEQYRTSESQLLTLILTQPLQAGAVALINHLC